MTNAARAAPDDLDVGGTGSYVYVRSGKFPRTHIAEASSYSPTKWYLNRVFVHAASRGQGIGQQMVTRLQEELRARGATELVVEPGGYGSDPEKLAVFYGKLGFVSGIPGSMIWKPG
jgi:GNAT superfamily N-acetyltransferase